MDKFFRYIIFDMPNGLRLALILLLFLINYGAEFLIKRSVLKVYRKTESAEEAVNKLRIYNQYCLVILQIVTVVPLEFLVVKYFIRYGKTGRIIFMLIAPFTFLMVINVGQLLIINKTYKRIRGTTESLFNQIRDIALTLLLILLPIGVIGTVSSFADGLDIESKALEGIIAAATPITMMILFNLALPFLYPKLLKAVPLEDENLRALLVRLFAKAGMKSAQLYQWPTKEKKVANALVVGVVKPKVLLATTFWKTLSPVRLKRLSLRSWTP